MKLIILFLFLNHFLFAQELHYLFVQSSSSYEELTNATISAAIGNDGSEVVQLPFVFQYGELPYPITSVRISVNGWISPGTTYNGTGWLNDLASATMRPLIAPLWDDLYDDATSEISYSTIGNLPQRIFVVQWKGIRWNGSNGVRQNFQIRLYEEDFRIEFIYGAMTQPSGVSASIGMNTISSPTSFISVTPGNPATTSQTTAHNGVNSVAFLNSGTKYSFIPLVSATTVRVFQVNKKVARGAVNQPIIGIQFSLSGPITPPNVTRFRFRLGNTTNASDIVNAKVFYSGSNPKFDDKILFGALPSPADSFDIVGNQTVGITSYFWLTYDISPTAQIGNLLDAACLMVAPIGFPDTVNPFGERIIVEGVGGEFTIGAGMNYNTLTEALAFLDTSALKSHVTLKLKSGYNSANEIFPIVLKAINGANSFAKIIIKPDETLQQLTITGSASAIFDLNQADNFIISGRRNEQDSLRVLTIENNYSQGNVIRFDGSTNCKIDFCNLLGNNSSTIGGVVHMRTNSGFGNVANTISNSFISRTQSGKPNSGIYFTGNIFPQNLKNEILNCEITNFHDAGIYLTGGTFQTKISGCEIHHTEFSSSSTVYGIRIDNADAEIFNNKIYDINTMVITPSAIKGIFIIGSLGSSISINVYNNFISMTGNAEAPVDGIDYYGYAENSASFMYNTIYLSGGGFINHSSAGIKKRSASNNMKILNNIIVNKRYNLMGGDGKHYAIYVSNSQGITAMNYNDYFSLGAYHHIGYWNGSILNDLASWQNQTQFDPNSISKDVNFVSDDDLHLAGNSIGDVDLIASPINFIAYDIDNELRSLSHPYKGADENILNPLPVELASFNGIVSNEIVTLSWKTLTEKNNFGFEVYRSLRGEQFERIGFVKGYGTSLSSHEYVFKDDFSEFITSVQNIPIKYRLKQIDFNGTFSYSNEIVIDVNSVGNNPTEFMLYQNYPNPFNPTTTINYQIPKAGRVALRVYDILGTEVATLINEEKEVGRYSVNFDANSTASSAAGSAVGGLSSGVYLYELVVNDYKNVKKMIFLK